MRVFLSVIAVLCIALAMSLSFFFIKAGSSLYPQEVKEEALRAKEISFRTAKVKEIDSAIDAAVDGLKKTKMEGEKVEGLKERLEEVRSNVGKLKQVLPKDENNSLVEGTIALLSNGSHPDIPQIEDIKNLLGELEIYWEPDFKLMEEGQNLYEYRCVSCHGEKGNGHPRTPEKLAVAPRDFTGESHFIRGDGNIVKDGKVVFKFSSAQQGPALEEDIEDTIRNGLPGTPMPGFADLTEEEIKALTEYVMGFGYMQWRFGMKKPDPAVVDLKVPDDLAEALKTDNFKPVDDRIQKGRTFFQAACGVCHGDIEDLGKNAKRLDLETNWLGQDGKPIDILPRNFATEPFKKGSPEQIYRTIRLGIKGTPMPGFSLPPDQIWNLVSYVEFLHEKYHKENSS
ncbi:MAG: hypothetical protein C4291_02740 [Candidatus Dadabacteria bacterium]